MSNPKTVLIIPGNQVPKISDHEDLMKDIACLMPVPAALSTTRFPCCYHEDKEPVAKSSYKSGFLTDAVRSNKQQ